MAQATGIPFHLFDSTGDAISGESRRAANEDLIGKIENFQNVFGSVHRAMYAFLLDLMGYEDEDVEISWKPTQTVNDVIGLQAAQAKIDLGVPWDQVMAELGYTADQIQTWAAERERKEAQKAAKEAAALKAQQVTTPDEADDQSTNSDE
jgi:hypothetical protein